MKQHLTGTAVACMAAFLAACGPKVQYTPDDPSDVRQARNVEDVKLLADGETPGPGYRTLGSVEVTSELSCNTAMTMSKESAKAIIDDYVKSHMDLAESTSQEVVEAMVTNGDLSKKQACKVLPIFSQIPEKEEILVAVLKGDNIDVLIAGTADAGGEGLYEVEHEIYKTRKKPALSGAGAVSPSLVVNVKSVGKVISLKEEEPEPEPEEEDEPEPEKKVVKKPKPKAKTEEVVVVKKSEPEPEPEEEDEEDEKETTVASAKKTETVLVKKTEPEKTKKKEKEKKEKEEESTAKAHADEPWPPPDVFADEPEEELDPKAAAAKAKKEAEEAMLAVKEAKKQAKLAKLAAEQAEKEKKKAAMLKKKAEAKAEAEAAKEAKKQAMLEKKKAKEEEEAKKKAELQAKKKAEAEAKKKAEAEAKKKSEKEKIEVEGTKLKKADDATIDEAKDIIRGWKKEIFVCLHKSDTVESAGKVALMFFIDIEGRLDALSINPQPESGIKECIMGTVGDLDYPEVGVTYEFSMKYKVKPE